MAAGQHRAAQIEVDGPVPDAVEVDVGDDIVLHHGAAGEVDVDGRRADGRHSLGDGGHDRLLARHVEPDEVGLPARLPDLVRGGLAARDVDVADDHPRAALGQKRGRGAADAGRCPREEGDLAVEPGHLRPCLTRR